MRMIDGYEPGTSDDFSSDRFSNDRFSNDRIQVFLRYRLLDW